MVFSKPREQFCNWGEYGGTLMEALNPTAQPDLFEKYYAAVQADKLFHIVDSVIRQRGKIMFTSIASAKEHARIRFGQYRERLLESRADLKRIFADEFPENVLEEWLDSLYMPKLIELDGYRNYK